ncbi:MAG: hybrid sensor histidine kinase/response regulator [Elusimicrobia bacterium]|nr:hybrid sensor histidine kinase/response regulator [Elusimicrobiota bacterium]
MAPNSSGSGAAPGASAERKVLVFLLEDDTAVIDLVQDAVEMQGWQLLHRSSCADAAATLRSARPDIALLDVNLPDGEGFSVCESLRKDPAAVPMPVIFLTSRGDPTSRLKGFMVGGQDYVTKPFLIQELVARIQAHLAIQAREAALSQELLKTRLHERVRQDIMDMVVHDLSAPLSTVKMTLDIIHSRGLIKDPSYARYLKSAENSIEFALVMIAGLLDLGAGTVKIDATELDLNALSQRLAKMFGLQYEIKKVGLEFDLLAEGVRVVSDQTLLFRVLVNLLANALKFSPPGAKVVVRVSKRTAPSRPDGRDGTPAGLRVEVADAGPGIPTAEKDAIFRKYHRATEAHVPGSGIGLAFCRMACESLQGRIWAEDAQPRGSRFILEVPSLLP